MSGASENDPFPAFARAIRHFDAVARMRRLAAARHPDLDEPMSILLARSLAGDGDLLASIGLRTITENGAEFTLFSRNHPYLDQIMQDADEGRRAWEKALLRTSGCQRVRWTDFGASILTPTGYLRCALILGPPDLEPAPKTL